MLVSSKLSREQFGNSLEKRFLSSAQFGKCLIGPLSPGLNTSSRFTRVNKRRQTVVLGWSRMGQLIQWKHSKIRTRRFDSQHEQWQATGTAWSRLEERRWAIERRKSAAWGRRAECRLVSCVWELPKYLAVDTKLYCLHCSRPHQDELPLAIHLKFWIQGDTKIELCDHRQVWIQPEHPRCWKSIKSLREYLMPINDRLSSVNRAWKLIVDLSPRGSHSPQRRVSQNSFRQSFVRRDLSVNCDYSKRIHRSPGLGETFDNSNAQRESKKFGDWGAFKVRFGSAWRLFVTSVHSTRKSVLANRSSINRAHCLATTKRFSIIFEF